jgi:hypothetical protein
MRQVEEALARQVLYGGDLVTNLLEVTHVDEAVLTEALASSMHLPPAPSGALPTLGESARALVSPEMAAEHVFVPIEVRGEELVLAVAEPLPADVKSDRARALGKRLVERAAIAPRIWQAIAQTYGVRPDRRMHRLIARLAGQEFPAALPLAPLMATTAPPPGRGPSEQPSANASSIQPVPGPSSMRPFSGRRVTLKTTVAPAPAGGLEPQPDVLPIVISRPGLLQRPLRPSVRVVHRRRGPLTFEAAREEAEGADERDDLLTLLFDFARQFFEYTALFMVHGDIAEGRDGYGSGANRERVLGIGIPLDLPSLLARAREARIPIVARPPPDGLDAVLLGDLNRPRDAETAIVPLVVRNRAVALLVGDCGDAGIDRAVFRQITEFFGVISKAFERMLVRRKVEGFVVARTRSSGRMDRVHVPSKRPAGATAPTPVAPGRAVLASTAPTDRAGAKPPTGTAPPPVNVASLRKIEGPPIPREDPESAGGPDGSATITHPPGVIVGNVATADTLGFSLPGEGHLDPDIAFDPVADSGLLPPPSIAISVPPHRPPRAHDGAAEDLPSVMLDTDGELHAIVDRIAGGEIDEIGEAELLRQGDRALRLLMAEFPGPTTFQRLQLTTVATPPRPSDCGPILRAVLRQRKLALPYVIERLANPDPEVRGWAAFVLCELPYIEALPPLLECLQDPDTATRTAAAHAVGAIARNCGHQVVDALVRFGQAAGPAERAASMRAMGEARVPIMVPELIDGLNDANEDVNAAAHAALVGMTRQDFGRESKAWVKWWEQNARRHRIEWLIDSLMHRESDIRRAAGDELRLQSRQYLGYACDLPPRERERAQQRYRDWWITEGRVRYLGP